MWTRQGKRGIVCAQCGNQNRTGNWACTCGKLWHKCQIHKVDPPEHCSKKNVTKPKETIHTDEDALMPTSRSKPQENAKNDSSSQARVHSQRLFKNAPISKYSLSIAACPTLAAKLAGKFPHRFKGLLGEGSADNTSTASSHGYTARPSSSVNVQVDEDVSEPVEHQLEPYRASYPQLNANACNHVPIRPMGSI